MSSFLLSKSEQGIVVFHFWKSLGYIPRIFISFMLILTGFVCQYYMLHFFPGILLVLAGNLLLLVKGYDNRIKLEGYSADTEWIKTDFEQLKKILDLNKNLTKWDVSALDITNSKGGCLFVIILILLIVSFVILIINTSLINIGLILVLDIIILLFPHWLTGVKRITTTPALVEKIKIYQSIIEKFKDKLIPYSLNYLMLVNNQKKFPSDVKMKLDVKDKHADFLGLYAQISMNDVNGSVYPYFYVVLVAKAKSKLIQTYYQEIILPDKVMKEIKEENDIEIMVIRQRTSKSSGYHTDDKAVDMVFNAGLNALTQVLS